MKAIKFIAHTQYHVTCVQGSPKPHVTIFDPRIVCSLYNFYGDTQITHSRGNVTVTVTVTEEFVVRTLQLVRWRITQSNCRV